MTRRASSQAPGRFNGAGRGLRIILGALVSGLFLWLAFREIRLDTVAGLASAWPILPIALSLLLQCVAFALRLARWGLAIRHLGEISWGRLLSIGSVGLSSVFLLPVRLGELVRPTLVAEESTIDFGRASATVVLERLVDGWIMSAAMFATLLALGERAGSSGLVAGAYLFAAAFLVAGALLAVGTIWRRRIAARIEAMLRRLSAKLGRWAGRLALGLLEALRHLAEFPVLRPYLLISLALWLAEAASIYALFGVLPDSLSWLAAFTVLSTLVVGSTVPSGPTQIGVFEYAVVVGLGLAGTAHAQAAAFGLLLHGLETTTVLAFGLAGTWAGGLRLQRLLGLAGQDAQPTQIQLINKAEK